MTFNSKIIYALDVIKQLLIAYILVWLGWYGFNVGSAFTFDQIAMVSFVNTVIAASAGALGWLILEYALKKRQVF